MPALRSPGYNRPVAKSSVWLCIVCFALLLAGACGSSSTYSYRLPAGVDNNLRIVRAGDPNSVLADTQDKGRITMRVGETLTVSAIYRFRSAIFTGTDEKDEFVTADSSWHWLEAVNDTLSFDNGVVTALKPGVDTLKAEYRDNDIFEDFDAKLEITVE